MKKIISLLLAAIMLMSCFAVSAFAVVIEGECTCSEDGTHNPVGSCHCCIFCPNLNPTFVTACARGSLNSGVKEVCCYECTGIVGCTCGCECCKTTDEDMDDDNSTLDEMWTDADKQSFVDGFQSILKIISDFFDNLFDTIFEFLGLEDVLGSEGANPEEQPY